MVYPFLYCINHLDRSPPIDLVIQAGVVPRICEFLSYDNSPELQYEAAWVLTNICSGTKDQVRFEIVQVIVRLL